MFHVKTETAQGVSLRRIFRLVTSFGYIFWLHSRLVVPLRFEEVGPRVDLGMLLEQRSPLTFRHSAPHTEFHAVVQSICATLHQHWAVPTDGCGFTLRRASNEQLVWIYFSTPGLRYPGNSCLCFFYVQSGDRGGHVHSVCPFAVRTPSQRRSRNSRSKWILVIHSEPHHIHFQRVSCITLRT